MIGRAMAGDTPDREVQSLLDQPQAALLVLPDLWGDSGSEPAQAAPQAVNWIARAAHASLDRMLVLDLSKTASQPVGERGETGAGPAGWGACRPGGQGRGRLPPVD
jgi:hypothetical protein